MLEFSSTIERMELIDWFSRAGQRDMVQCKLNLEYVASWNEALRLVGQSSTADAFEEGAGMLTRELGIRFRKDYRQWNSIVDDVNVALEESVLPSLDSVIASTPEIATAEDGVFIAKRSVRWDLLHYVMEHIYSDLVPPRFYTELFGIYQTGHFPCGWDEKWPDGTLWLF